MKAHILEVLILDHENYGTGEYSILIENNRHIHGRVIETQTCDIGDWSDDHPFNQSSTTAKQIKEAFCNKANS